MKLLKKNFMNFRIKNQTDFKSNLGEIKKSRKSKSEDQITVIQNSQNIFCLRENYNSNFCRGYSVFLSEAK